ncbi:MAG: J domain-containing protein, partial [Haloarculaceae archaeon]
ATDGRRAATDGRGGERAASDAGFGAGPRAAWERPGGESRERVRQARARQERARRQRAREHATRVGGGGRRVTRGQPPGGMTAREAASVLGVGPDADEDAVRTAYRERIKEVHPDTDGGDEDAFKRVRDAYERLEE